MYSLSEGRQLGIMKATPMLLKEGNSFYRNKTPILSMYINDLKAFAKRSKVGSDFIKFAKNLSRQENCEGRVHLLAYNTDNPGKPPHTFYRKMGFATTSPSENKILDDAIKNNTSIPADMCLGTTMFLKA